MLIVAGYVGADADRRDEYVAAHHDLLRRSRQAAGCLDVAISADALTRSRVNIYECWESQERRRAVA